jgi:hypothetical protein
MDRERQAAAESQQAIIQVQLSLAYLLFYQQKNFEMDSFFYLHSLNESLFLPLRFCRQH